MKISAGVFPQKVRTFYTEKQGLESKRITALAFDGKGILYAGTADGLYMLDGEVFKKAALGGGISLLYQCSCGTLFAGSGNEIYGIRAGKVVSRQTLPSRAVKLGEDDRHLWLITSDEVYRYEDGEFKLYTSIEYGNATDMTVFGDGRLYVVIPFGVLAMHGKRPHWGLLASITSDMPDCRVSAIDSDKWGHIWVGTDKGVLLYDSYSAWYTCNNMPYLTKGKIRTLLLGKNGARYIGTEYGLVIQDEVRDSCLTPGRWLPRADITCVAASDDGRNVWVGTEDGLAKISFIDMTLTKKAEHFQQLLDKYYEREGQFTHLRLEEPGNIASGKPEISDNDGLWTGVYAGVQSYKYAVTKQEQARDNARRAMNALHKLENITGIPGFTARSYRRPGEDDYGDGHIEWHRTKDEISELEWKGETSSDEIVGHFFGMSLYFDLCADEAEKKKIAASISAIADHAIENGGTLRDVDGLPTTWAHWGPDELNRDDMWFNERGVNSLEFLMMLKTAYHMTNDEKYQQKYTELVCTEHYALNAAKHKVEDAHVTHIDDNLCFLTSITLFRYEDDPYIRQLLLMGLRHHWEYERIERAPLWNLAYGALTGACCDLDVAIRSLEELPLDFISYGMVNSIRPDIKWDSGQELFDGERQLVEPLPYDEGNITNIDANPFKPDRNIDGDRYASNPHIYLLPYWLGRYHGLIAED